MPDLPLIPIICGPTGSGKTDAALQICERLPAEIVSADSRQVIRRLDIGTAKPTEAERSRVVFHLLDQVNPGERYSAWRFVDDAVAAIAAIRSRNKIPLIVGGTGLYLKALTQGVIETPQDQPDVRRRLEEEFDAFGNDTMYRRLAEIDPVEAQKIHPNNRIRIIRALEIYEMTSVPKSELLPRTDRRLEADFSYYCLAPERAELYARINSRVDRMIEQGLVEEIDLLINEELTEEVRRSNVIGYNEILDWKEGRISRENAVEIIKQNSRRYAKRQMTWFRHQVTCRYFSNPDDLCNVLIENVMGNLDTN